MYLQIDLINGVFQCVWIIFLIILIIIVICQNNASIKNVNSGKTKALKRNTLPYLLDEMRSESSCPANPSSSSSSSPSPSSWSSHMPLESETETENGRADFTGKNVVT